MDSVLPFSVLKSKRVRHVKIIEEPEVTTTSHLRQADYDKNLIEVTGSGLYVLNEHIHFVTRYIYYFYRNNLAVLFLTLNIMHDPNFVNTQFYKPYVDYIQRRQYSEEKQEKHELVIIKLNVQIKAYMKKVENLMRQIHITHI